MKKTLWSVVAAGFVLAGCGGVTDGERALAQPTVVPDDWTCATVTYYLGRNFGNDSFKIAAPASGTYGPIDAAGDLVTLASSNGIEFDWTATTPIRAILMSAGPGTTVAWVYVPPEPGKTGSFGIYAHDAGTPQTRFAPTYIDFCFDAPPQQRLEVTKTARTSLKATYGWTIDKRGSVSDLTLSAGQQFLASYTVDASGLAVTYSDFAAAGEIAIHNPAPVAATITGVLDAIGEVPVTPSCGVAFPFTLGAGAILECSYAAALPDGSGGVNTVTVTTAGPVAGATASAAVDFATAAITEVDATASVTDSRAGLLGTAPRAGASFAYPLVIGPYAACGDYLFDNTASFVTVDTGATGSDAWNVAVHVPCAGGCTLTPGYWKTHSKYGPAAYDDTWALLPGGEDAAFFLSGMSWYQVLWTPSSSGAYFQLARAFVAARLNQLNGADMSAVAAPLATAQALFSTYAPAAVTQGQVRAQFVSTAARLDAFNAGLTGPGHCDE